MTSGPSSTSWVDNKWSTSGPGVSSGGIASKWARQQKGQQAGQFCQGSVVPTCRRWGPKAGKWSKRFGGVCGVSAVGRVQEWVIRMEREGGGVEGR